MKSILKVNIIFLVFLSLIMFYGCTKKHDEIEYNYEGFLVSGESMHLKFVLTFKDPASKNIAERRKDNFMHALEIMFPSYKHSQLSKSKIKSLLQKASNQVFYDSVESIDLISLKYGK